MRAPTAALIIAILAAAAASAAAAPAGTVFRRACADCPESTYCEYGFPGTPDGAVACTAAATGEARSLYRRYETLEADCLLRPGAAGLVYQAGSYCSEVTGAVGSYGGKYYECSTPGTVLATWTLPASGGTPGTCLAVSYITPSGPPTYFKYGANCNTIEDYGASSSCTGSYTLNTLTTPYP
ncbi:hypothetical protein DFJ74DRAFT_764081 [Hyaloraphidium curvatum]|nr:hypothetical protein DFJ74DRAFT_764081 [Hyaloraphidium curvatum]